MAAPDTLTIGAALARAGYVATPLRREDNDRFVQAKIASTPVDLLLDSGAPFDLLLDSSLDVGKSSGVHITDVLSGYWTFTPTQGRWAIVDRLALDALGLEALEAKVEPSPVTARALLGGTALISRGAIVDYATDTLYLLAPHEASALPQPAVRQPTLRAALEQAGQYRTFLDLMQQAGLSALLDSTAGRRAAPDSVAWLGLRIKAEQLSGVGGMEPNDVHLRLTREAVARWHRGPGWLTAFVPTDAAFARLPVETLRGLRADTARLARLLRSHLYPGVAIDTSAIRTLIRGVARPGSESLAFGFHVLGTQIDVDQLADWETGRVMARASIVQPDLKVGHGTAVAHGIDRVLGPFATPSPFVAALLRQGYVGIPLYRHEDGNGYLVRATVNNVPVQLTLATGSPLEVVLDRQWASRLPPGRDYLVTFDSVRLGPVKVDTADFSRAIQSAQRQGYRTTAGLVGSALLARYHARMDYAAGMLYLRLPTAARDSRP